MAPMAGAPTSLALPRHAPPAPDAGVFERVAEQPAPLDPARPCHRRLRPVDSQAARPQASGVWRATGREEPVFLDHSGRRLRLMRVAGAGFACAAAAWLAALVSGALGFASLPGPAPLTAAVVRVPAPVVVHRRAAPARRRAAPLLADRDPVVVRRRPAA